VHYKVSANSATTHYETSDFFNLKEQM